MSVILDATVAMSSISRDNNERKSVSRFLAEQLTVSYRLHTGMDHEYAVTTRRATYP